MIYKLVGVVLAMFVLNAGLAHSTRWLFTHCEFPFPIFLTFLHMLFAALACQLFCPGGKASESSSSVWPLSLCFSLSVASGNAAIRFIFPSFAQMLGTATPLAVLLFQDRATLLRHAPSVSLICVGLLLCSFDEGHFHPLGVSFSVLATVLRAAKAVLQKQLLTSDAFDSVSLLRVMALQSACVLFVASLIFEQPQNALGISTLPISSLGLAVLSNCIVACLLNITNFETAQLISPVSQQLLGNVKTVFAVLASAFVFANEVSQLQLLGCALSLGGVWLYNH